MSRRKVVYEVEVDTSNAERSLDGLARDRGGRGGGVGSTGRGGGARGGVGAGGAFLAGRAAGGGAGGLIAGAARAVPIAAAAAAVAGTVVPGGMNTISDAMYALTSELKNSQRAIAENSPIRGVRNQLQARDTAAEQTAGNLGLAGLHASPGQIMSLQRANQRLELDRLRARDRVNGIIARNTGSPVTDIVKQVNDRTTSAVQGFWR